MKFPSTSDDIITIHDDQWVAHECYITILRPKDLVLAANNIERKPGASITLTGEDLDRRIGFDSRFEPVKETRALELSPRKALKLGASLSHNDQALVEETLKGNADLIAWSATILPGVASQVAIHKL